MYVTPAPTSIVLVTGLGPGSIRHTTPSCCAVTQILPAPTAIAVPALVPMRIFWPTRFVRGSICVTTDPLSTQIPSVPAAILSASTSIVATSLPVSGSIRETVWSGLSAQTAPAPTAMSGKPQLYLAVNAPPVLSGSVTVWVIARVLGSKREMLTVKLPAPGFPLILPPPFPTHSAPSPAAISVGTPRVLSLPVTALVSGSRRNTVLSCVFSAQTPPAPTATLLGGLGDSMNEATLPPAESMTATPFPTGARRT